MEPVRCFSCGFAIGRLIPVLDNLIEDEVQRGALRHDAVDPAVGKLESGMKKTRLEPILAIFEIFAPLDEKIAQEYEKKAPKELKRLEEVEFNTLLSSKQQEIQAEVLRQIESDIDPM